MVFLQILNNMFGSFMFLMTTMTVQTVPYFASQDYIFNVLP